MALLSISEPGQGKAQTVVRKNALGIDLGTTNSLVAIAEDGKTTVLRDEDGGALLPSVVRYLSNGEIQVGKNALNNASQDPENTIASVKRLMGRGAEDIKHDLPYQLNSESKGGMVQINTPQGIVSPVEVSAQILKVLAERGRQYIEGESDGEIEGVVITVPAYFDESQRQATKDAARIAGINVLRLLSEPTAAAVAYGLDRKQEETVIIYDLGGGTFDVSLMRLQKGVFEVLATGGDAALGGDDMDRALINWIIESAKLDGSLTPKQLQELSALARSIKHELSGKDEVTINYADWTGNISRNDFEKLIEPLVEKTLKVCRRVLRDGGISKEEISDIVMVGGSTRTPFVREKVSEFFAQELLTDIDPDQVVAIGAALQADVLAGNKYGEDMLLLDVIPLSLGIETMGGLVEKIIPRNTTIPVTRAQEFTTYKDGQTAMSLHVLQGERELVEDCRSLASFGLKDIPPMVAGAAVIRVTFQVDADGLMEVQATETSTGTTSSIVVKPSYGLEDKDIESMIQNSYEAAERDKRLRSLKENQVEAAQLIDALNAALEKDGSVLLSEDELAGLQNGIKQLQSVLTGDDAEKIRKAAHKLNEESAFFASRRMDSQIKTALAGQSLEEFEK